MNDFNFNGMGVALITPFDREKRIDYERLSSLTERLINSGTDYIVVMGTTAETPTLTEEEKICVRQTVSETVAGRVPLVLGFGGNCTSEMCNNLHNWDGNGYNAILTVTPYYNKPSQRGMYEHFKAIAEASPLPVILYNVPGRTGVNLQPQTTIQLATEVEEIIAIKEASGNLSQVKETIAGAPRDFTVISGDDAITAEMIGLGAKGVISVIGNASPKIWRKLTHAALTGDIQSALELEKALNPLLSMLFQQGNPSGIKALMNELGLCHGSLRLPLTEVDDELKSQMQEFIATHSTFFN